MSDIPPRHPMRNEATPDPLAALGKLLDAVDGSPSARSVAAGTLRWWAGGLGALADRLDPGREV